ncbi:CHAP domain-containing protein [Streptococcus suis]|uniref:CHAP domain-containing protein n=1 Tax=Streptococcus suis TaxID=1307 RepID=UPI0005D24CBD|nr:CHAP domain-containing protein [Streptococcus suis]CYY96630.1 NlpC/P60 family protein [Streptococcus suis]
MGKSKRMVRETNKKHYAKSKPDIRQRKEEQDFSGRTVDESVKFQHKIIHKESKLESKQVQVETFSKRQQNLKILDDKSTQTPLSIHDKNESTIQIADLQYEIVNKNYLHQPSPPEAPLVESKPISHKKQGQLQQRKAYENQQNVEIRNEIEFTEQNGRNSEIFVSSDCDLTQTGNENEVPQIQFEIVHQNPVNSSELNHSKELNFGPTSSQTQAQNNSQATESIDRKIHDSPFRKFDTNQSRIIDTETKFTHRRNEGRAKLIHNQNQGTPSQFKNKKGKKHVHGDSVYESQSILSELPISQFDSSTDSVPLKNYPKVSDEYISIIEQVDNESVFDVSLQQSQLRKDTKKFQPSNSKLSKNNIRVVKNSQSQQIEKTVTLTDGGKQSSNQFQSNLNENSIMIEQISFPNIDCSKKLHLPQIKLFSRDILHSNAVGGKIQNDESKPLTRKGKGLPNILSNRETKPNIARSLYPDTTSDKNRKTVSKSSKTKMRITPIQVDGRPKYYFATTTKKQFYKGRLSSTNNIKANKFRRHRLLKNQLQIHEKLNSLVIEPIEFVKDKKNRRLLKKIEQAKLGRIKSSPLKKVVSGLASSEFLAASYLQAGADDNVAVDATSKVLNINAATLMRLAKKSNRNKTIKKLTRKAKVRQSQLEFRHKYRLMREDKIFQRQSFYRKSMYRQRMKQQIRNKHFPRIRDRIKEELKKLLNQMVQFITTRWKSFLVLALALFSLLTVVYSNSQFMFGALSSVSYQLTTTSYLSSEEMLVALNHIFSTYELNLSNQLARLKESKPGYDEYIVKGREQIGHDTHVLLAYLTARFGEIKDQTSVEPAMKQLFDQIYQVSYREEREIRYRKVKEEVIDTSGKKTIVEKEVPYTYRKLIATVSKNDMDVVIQSIFAGSPSNLEHYRILRETKGNLETAFPSGTTISLPGNVSSVYDVNLTGGNFPPPNPNHVAALNGGYPGQCTWYVYNRFSQLGKPIQHSPMGNGGEWAFYAAKYGYPVSREARAGTAVCMPPTVPYADPTYGHIAFVERVNPDGSIVISEMNVKGEFVISTGYLPREMAAQCYYINFGL